MMPKEIFKEILQDPDLAEKTGIGKKELDNIGISDKVENDHIAILRLILYALDNRDPQQTTYKNVRKYFGIN